MLKKMQKLTGIMMLLYAPALLLLPYVQSWYSGAIPGVSQIPEFVSLIKLAVLTGSDLFRIPIVSVLPMLFGGILALKKPCVPVLLADGILCICARLYAGYLNQHRGAIFSEFTVFLENSFDVEKADFSFGFWAAVLCTDIALIGCIFGLIGWKKQEPDQQTEGESSC